MKTILMIMAFFMALGSAQATVTECYKEEDPVEKIISYLKMNNEDFKGVVKLKFNDTKTLTREYQSETFQGDFSAKSASTYRDNYCTASYENLELKNKSVEVPQGRTASARLRFSSSSNRISLFFDDPADLTIICKRDRDAFEAGHELPAFTVADFKNMGFEFDFDEIKPCPKAIEGVQQINFEAEEKVEVQDIAI